MTTSFIDWMVFHHPVGQGSNENPNRIPRFDQGAALKLHARARAVAVPDTEKRGSGVKICHDGGKIGYIGMNAGCSRGMRWIHPIHEHTLYGK